MTDIEIGFNVCALLLMYVRRNTSPTHRPTMQPSCDLMGFSVQRRMLKHIRMPIYRFGVESTPITATVRGLTMSLGIPLP